MKKSKVPNIKVTTLLKGLICGLGVFLASDLPAQLLYKTKFSAVEGYTNGWAIGQPSIGNKWVNANDDFAWAAANDPTYVRLNNGHSWTNEDGTPFYITSVINSTAPGGGAMKIASDGNYGTNAQTYFFKMDFPTTRRGPITVTWDWQFFSTNEIPADYDPYTNRYQATLPGYDHGFTFSDYANRTADGAVSNPNWVYSELSTPFRLSTFQDGRNNAVGTCGGLGTWNDYGPEFKDHKLLHMKLIAHVTNAPAEYRNTYEGFCQRDGETNWQTAFKEDTWVSWVKDGDIIDYFVATSGMRRCAGETDPTSGINCLMLWMNGNQYPRYVLVSNIRVVGPDPVATPTLSIGKNGPNVEVTFTGWLEAADSLAGPWTTVAVQSPYVVPGGGGAIKYYRAEN